MHRLITNSVFGNNWEGEWEFRGVNRIEIRHGVLGFFQTIVWYLTEIACGNLRENFIPFFG